MNNRGRGLASHEINLNLLEEVFHPSLGLFTPPPLFNLAILDRIFLYGVSIIIGGVSMIPFLLAFLLSPNLQGGSICSPTHSCSDWSIIQLVRDVYYCPPSFVGYTFLGRHKIRRLEAVLWKIDQHCCCRLVFSSISLFEILLVTKKSLILINRVRLLLDILLFVASIITNSLSW